MSLLVLSVTAARADELGRWTFTVPTGAKKAESGDQVQMTKHMGKTFCQYTLFAARAPAADDYAFEWKNVVENNFTVKTSGKPQTRKAKNLTYIATSATVTAGGNTWPVTHYFVQPQGAVSSVLLTASDRATLARCPIAAFLDSLVLAPAQESTQPTTLTKDAIVVGHWGTATSAYQNGVSLGYQLRRYAFNADGTYTWHFEGWAGHNRASYYQIIHETGRWTLDGTKLSIDPKVSTQTVIDKDKQVTKRPLEKVTYTVQTVFLRGIQKWYLVMAIGRPTDRDGPYTLDAKYPSSYVLEENPLLEWKYPADR